MRFTADELAEIRSAFRQRIKTEPTHQRPTRRKPKPKPLPALVREPDYDDDKILSPAQIGDLWMPLCHLVGAVARDVRAAAGEG